MSTVIVGCKLPNGFTLQIGEKFVELNGLNKTNIIGAQEGYTEVDASLWSAWLADNKDKSWCTSQAIFAKENLKEAKAKAKDLRDVKTGLEPIEQKEGND